MPPRGVQRTFEMSEKGSAACQTLSAQRFKPGRSRIRFRRVVLSLQRIPLGSQARLLRNPRDVADRIVAWHMQRERLLSRRRGATVAVCQSSPTVILSGDRPTQEIRRGDLPCKISSRHRSMPSPLSPVLVHEARSPVSVAELERRDLLLQVPVTEGVLLRNLFSQIRAAQRCAQRALQRLAQLCGRSRVLNSPYSHCRSHSGRLRRLRNKLTDPRGDQHADAGGTARYMSHAPIPCKRSCNATTYMPGTTASRRTAGLGTTTAFGPPLSRNRASMASFRLVGSLSAAASFGSDAGSTSTGAGSAASPSMPIMPAVSSAASAMYGLAHASSACGVAKSRSVRCGSSGDSAKGPVHRHAVQQQTTSVRCEDNRRVKPQI